jgi:hypothetical protein
MEEARNMVVVLRLRWALGACEMNDVFKDLFLARNTSKSKVSGFDCRQGI